MIDWRESNGRPADGSLDWSDDLPTEWLKKKRRKKRKERKKALKMSLQQFERRIADVVY